MVRMPFVILAEVRMVGEEASADYPLGVNVVAADLRHGGAAHPTCKIRDVS